MLRTPRLGAMIVLSLVAGCDANPWSPTPVELETTGLTAESPDFAAASLPVVQLRDGGKITLDPGDVVRLAPSTSTGAPRIVSYRSWRHPIFLRIDIFSEADFDATKITGRTEQFGIRKLWVDPLIQTIDGKLVRIVEDVNRDGLDDLGLLFGFADLLKAALGNPYRLQELVVEGNHPQHGAFRAVAEPMRAETNPWSSSDPSVVAIDPSGVLHASGSGSAVIRYQDDARKMSMQVTVAGKPIKPQGHQAGVYTPAGLDTSGRADVTRALLDFFDSVPNGSTIRFPANARYRVEGTLVLENRNGLTIDGNGAVLFARTDGGHTPPPDGLGHRWPRRRAHLVIHGGGDLVIRDLHIQGPHARAGTDGVYVADLEGQHGIAIRGARGVELDRVRVTDVYGDFVYLGGDAGEADRWQWARDIHIHDSHFERNGRQGFAFTAAENVLLENSYIGDVKRTALDIEPNGMGGGAKGLQVRNNTFGSIGGHWLAGHGKVGTIEDITLEGNTVHAKMQVSTNTFGPRRSNFRIVDNVSDHIVGSPAPLMALHRIDGIVVRGNVHPLNPRRKMTGVYVTQSCGVEISENRFTGAAREHLTVPFGNCSAKMR
jgi:hypothetical protein